MKSKNIENELHAIADSIESLMMRPTHQLKPHVGGIFDILLRFYELVERALDNLPRRENEIDDDSPPRILS